MEKEEDSHQYGCMHISGLSVDALLTQKCVPVVPCEELRVVVRFSADL